MDNINDVIELFKEKGWGLYSRGVRADHLENNVYYWLLPYAETIIDMKRELENLEATGQSPIYMGNSDHPTVKGILFTDIGAYLEFSGRASFKRLAYVGLEDELNYITTYDPKIRPPQLADDQQQILG